MRELSCRYLLIGTYHYRLDDIVIAQTADSQTLNSDISHLENCHTCTKERARHLAYPKLEALGSTSLCCSYILLSCIYML